MKITRDIAGLASVFILAYAFTTTLGATRSYESATKVGLLFVVAWVLGFMSRPPKK